MNDPFTILLSLRHKIPPKKTVMTAPEQYSKEKWIDLARRDEDVANVLEMSSGSLTRQQILEIRHPEGNVRRRRIFAAALIWGYGIRGHRYNTAVGRVTNALSWAELPERLKQCELEMRRGQNERAFAVMKGFPSVGSAFFTKYMYFQGRLVNRDGRFPLIRDGQVAKSLAMLYGVDRLVRGTYGAGDDAKSYSLFVDTIHGWAAGLGVSADQLEYFLWKPINLKAASDEAWAAS